MDEPATAPSNLRAKPGDRTIYLTWNPVPTATGYRIRHGTIKPKVLMETLDAIIDVGAKTNATIHWQNGQPVFFVVSAYNTHGEGPATAEQSATAIPTAG